MTPDPITPTADEVEVLFEKEGYPYRRQEVWTDGEWIRLGRDVLNNRCLEIKVEEMRDFIETLRAQTGVAKHTVTDSRGSDEKYIVNAEYSLDVYRNRQHILHHSDHEYGVLYSALDRALDKRETFDYEKLTRSYAESLKRSYWEIREVSDSAGRGVSVEVVHPEAVNVNLNFVDELRDDEYVIFDESGNIYIDGDDLVYQFRIRATDLPGAPDDDE